MGSVRLSGGLLFLLSILYPHGHYASVFARKDNDEWRDLYMETTRRTWDNASQSCNLYGSDKASSYVASVQDITFVRHNRLKATITPSPEDLYWIGATSTFTPLFELLGCYVYMPINKSHIRALRNLSTVVGPVTDCYLHCTSHFGVNDTHCFCPEKMGKGFLNRTCRLATSSVFQSDVIGTNTVESYFPQFAMYEIYNGPFKIKENSLDECLMINTADDVRTYPCDTADSTGRTWTTAIIEGLPSNNGGSLQWTSFLRRRIIRWTQNTERSTHQMVTSSLTADTERPSSTVSLFVVSTVYSVTEDESGSLPVIVGAIVGGAVLLLIVAGIGIVRQRRHAHSTPQPKSVETQNVYYSELTRNSEDHIALHISSHRSTNNEYDETSGPITQSTDRATEGCKLLPANDDGVYNHPWDKPLKGQQSDHVYSTTCSGSEYDYSQVPSTISDVYNHTWDSPNTEQLTDHVYSTTGSGNDANLYDHTGSKKSNLTHVNNENYTEPLSDIYTVAETCR
ncbi:uncharacterized protein [Magallana gigas]|uniref:uncharacterized protein isoform X2 n=1 Tax=Magallana gigas TaxID=29159 RepID=UPI00334167D5